MWLVSDPTGMMPNGAPTAMMRSHMARAWRGAVLISKLSSPVQLTRMMRTGNLPRWPSRIAMKGSAAVDTSKSGSSACSSARAFGPHKVALAHADVTGITDTARSGRCTLSRVSICWCTRSAAPVDECSSQCDWSSRNVTPSSSSRPSSLSMTP